jgi:hypothetical protein
MKDSGFNQKEKTLHFCVNEQRTYTDGKDSGLNQKEKRMLLPFENGQRIFPERMNIGFNLRVKAADLPWQSI